MMERKNFLSQEATFVEPVSDMVDKVQEILSHCLGEGKDKVVYFCILPKYCVLCIFTLELLVLHEMYLTLTDNIP